MKITVWDILKKDGSTLHNHIENGWVEGNYPKPLKEEFTNQKSWENMDWVKKYATLVNDVVVYENDSTIKE